MPIFGTAIVARPERELGLNIKGGSWKLLWYNDISKPISNENFDSG